MALHVECSASPLPAAFSCDSGWSLSLGMFEKGGCARIALHIDGLWSFEGGYTIPYVHALVFRAVYTQTWEQEVTVRLIQQG